MAVVFGDIRDGEDVPVRLHSRGCRRRRLRHQPPARRDHERWAQRRRGVIVYLREGSVGVAHQARNRPDARLTARTTTRRAARESEWREIGLGAQILKDLGITSILLIASRERHYVGLEGFGIRIVKTEIL